MSHKTPVQVRVDNEAALTEALKEMGYSVRVGSHSLSGYDWSMECDLSVLKDEKQLNIGFRKTDDGYEVEADWWGSGINSKDFQEQLNQLHGKHKTKNWLTKKGYKVTYAYENDGALVVTGSKWS